MRTLGLIGGISWQSTQLYYRYLNEGAARRLGEGHNCPHVLVTADFHAIHERQQRGAWSELNDMMAEYGRRLQRAGAEAIVICANTMHLCAPAIEAATGLPVLHIADATGAAIKEQDISQVGLLGTRYTMEKDFLKARLRERFDVEVIVPLPLQRADIHEVIYEELTRGILTEPSRKRYAEVVEALAERGANGVILGCTEIPLLIGDEDVSIPTFDTTRLHAEAALEWALGGR